VSYNDLPGKVFSPKRKRNGSIFYAGFIVNSYKTVTGKATLFLVERYLIQYEKCGKIYCRITFGN